MNATWHNDDILGCDFVCVRFTLTPGALFCWKAAVGFGSTSPSPPSPRDAGSAPHRSALWPRKATHTRPTGWPLNSDWGTDATRRKTMPRRSPRTTPHLFHGETWVCSSGCAQSKGARAPRWRTPLRGRRPGRTWRAAPAEALCLFLRRKSPPTVRLRWIFQSIRFAVTTLHFPASFWSNFSMNSWNSSLACISWWTAARSQGRSSSRSSRSVLRRTYLHRRQSEKKRFKIFIWKFDCRVSSHILGILSDMLVQWRDRDTNSHRRRTFNKLNVYNIEIYNVSNGYGQSLWAVRGNHKRGVHEARRGLGRLPLREESATARPHVPILHSEPVSHEVCSSSIPMRVTGWFWMKGDKRHRNKHGIRCYKMV